MLRKILALTLLAASTPALAQEVIRTPGRVGVGVGGGTIGGGVSVKTFIDETMALQFLAAARTYDYGTGAVGWLAASADLLFEMPAFAETEPMDIAWSVGPGVALGVATGKSSTSSTVAISGVAGIEFLFKPVPIDFVLEARPTIVVVPGVSFATNDLVEVGGHVRWYF